MRKEKNWKRLGAKALSLTLAAAMVVGTGAGAMGLSAISAKAEENTQAEAMVKVTLTDEQLAKYYKAVNQQKTSVHDPSVIRDTKTGRYYIFGSHLAWAYSDDLETWTTFTNNLNKDFATIFAENAAWSALGSANYDVSGYLWAPDVIYNEEMGKWCMYMSVAGELFYSSIVMLTSDSLDGDWTLVDTIVYSGFASAEQAAKTDYAKATGDTEFGQDDIQKYTAFRNSTRNRLYGMNAIDPCVFYDEDGNLWMSYGSWFGGIYLLKLDAKTGLRDYTYTYEDVDNTSDIYQGIKLAGGAHSTGEASYIQKINGKYYLFVTYGGLTANGGYNMRVFSADKLVEEQLITSYEAIEGTQVSLTGIGWWPMDIPSTGRYALEDGQTRVFQVSADALDNGYGAFSFELADSAGHILTTNSDKNAWYFADGGTTGDAITGVGSVFSSDLTAKANYYVTVTRAGSDYTIKYLNSDGSVISEFGAKNTNINTGTVSAYVMAQVGTYTISECTEETSIVRSSNFVDNSGDTAKYTNASVMNNANKGNGERLMTYYKWSWWKEAQLAQGHNSAYVDEDGNAFLVYHTRTDNGTEEHYVRVHSLFTTKSGYLVASPMAYASTDTNQVDVSAVAGQYEVILHTATDFAKLQSVGGSAVTLYEDGTLDGAYQGTWSATQNEDGTASIDLTIGGVVYEGILLEQTLEGSDAKTVCFTGAGANDICIWGAKLTDETAVAYAAQEALAGTSIEDGDLIISDVVLGTAQGMGVEVSWTSSDEGIIATNGTYTIPEAAKDVTLTLTVSRNDVTFTKQYTVHATNMNATTHKESVLYSDTVIDNTTGFLVNRSEEFTLAGDFDTTLTFKNEAFIGAEENWFNFVLETVATGEAAGVTMRADNYGWNYGAATAAQTPSFAGSYTWNSWEEFREICKSNQMITVNAKKADQNTVIFTLRFGDAATEVYTLTYPNGVPETLQYHVGGEKDKVTLASYENHVADDVVGTPSKAYGKVVGSDNSFAINSEIYTVAGDFDATLTFYNDPFYVNETNWFNFLFEILSSADAAGLTMRADAFGWTFNEALAAQTPSFDVSIDWDWAKFVEICKENRFITLNVKKVDLKTVAVTIKFGDAATEVYTVTYPAGVPENFSFHVGGENALVTLLTYESSYTTYEAVKNDSEENPGTDEGDNTGSEEGDNTGSEEGDNTGSEEGDNTGSEEDDNTGSEEGGNTGSEEGGNTGSEEGDNTGSEEDSSETVETPEGVTLVEQKKDTQTTAQTTKDYTLDNLAVEGFWSAHTEGVEITGETTTITFTTTSNPEAAANWNTPFYVLYTGTENKVNGAGYQEYMVTRSDVYGWAPGGNTAEGLPSGYTWTVDQAPADWEAWLAQNKEGVSSTLTATKQGNTVVLVLENGDAKSTLKVNMKDAKDNIYVSLSGELCKLTDIHVKSVNTITVETTVNTYSDGSVVTIVKTTDSNGKVTTQTTKVDASGNESKEETTEQQPVVDESTDDEKQEAEQPSQGAETVDPEAGEVIESAEEREDEIGAVKESYELAGITVDGFWSAHTAAIPVTTDLTKITFHAQSAAGSTNNWDSPLYVLFGADEKFAGGTEGPNGLKNYKEYLVTRSDVYAWNAKGNSFDNALGSGYSWKQEGPADWDQWLADNLAGVDCTITVRRSGNYVLITMDNAGAKSTAAVNVENATSPLYLTLSGEKCTVSNVKVEVFGGKVNESEETNLDELIKDAEVEADTNNANTDKTTETIEIEQGTIGDLLDSYSLADVDASGWWVAHTKAVPITKELTKITFHSTTYANASSNWNTPIFVLFAADEAFAGGAGIDQIKGYYEYMVTRSDAYGWNLPADGNTQAGLGKGYGFTSNVGDGFDWAAWVAANKQGVDCELTVQLIDGYVVATLTNNGVTSTTTVKVDDNADRMYVALSGELCKLTNLQVEVYESEGASITEVEETEDDEKKDPEKNDSEKTDSDKQENNSGTNTPAEEATGKADEVEADVDGLEDQGRRIWPIFVAIIGGTIALAAAGTGAVFGRKKATAKKNADK